MKEPVHRFGLSAASHALHMSAAAHLTSVDANDVAEVEALLEALRARSPSANAQVEALPKHASMISEEIFFVS